jgi:hypothetical protein
MSTEGESRANHTADHAGDRPGRTQRLATAAVAAAAVAGIVYVAVRFSQTVWFSKPFYGFTSGSEEEALYSIWKWLHGQPVYGDMFDIPYAASYFNWLFYNVYGSVNVLVLSTFHANEAMIPAISRCLTLICHVLNIVCLVAIGRQLKLGFFSSRWRAWAYGAFALLNLCYGLWAVTTRPDVSALLFELVGFWAILKHEDGRHGRWLALAVASLYLAWSCKQTSVSVITVYCAGLLLQRRFRELLWVALPTFALYAITFAVGGQLYRYACVFSQSTMGMSMSFGLRNFVLALVKAPLLGAAVCLVPAWVASGFRSLPPGRKLLASSFLFSSILALFTCMKAGAYVNYFFLPAALGALCLAAICDGAQSPKLAGLARWAIIGAALCQVVLIPQRLWFSNGGAVLAEKHLAAVRLKQELASLPPPVLVEAPSLNLPWIQPHAPHFVYAFTYFGDRARREFRHGGIGGLVRAGYFGTIVLSKGAVPAFDGQALERYAPERSDAYFDYYTRVP